DTLNQIVEKYITNLPKAKQKKALINNELLNQIKAILLNPKDISLCDKNTRSWAKKKFILEEIVPGDYRVLVKATNNPVQGPMSYPRQGIIEEFVNNCTACAVRKPAFHPLAAKPIIANHFLSRLQSNNGKEFVAQTIKELIVLWPSVKIINRHPRHPQSQGLVERANSILEQKLGKWRETTGRDDWWFGLRFVVVAMNNSWCRLYKKNPYEIVYGDKPRGNCSL
ncbi:1234_t:CDS:2, partial [Gigaspora rosea]